jgi:hypothetical protein
MTTNPPEAPEPQASPFQFDFDKWRAEDAERQAALAEQLAAIKTILFDFLEARGIVLVTVDFDGYGDSGQIEEMFAFDEHGALAVPKDRLSFATSDSDIITVKEDGEAVNDLVELLAYDLLENEHCGWEDNEGAYGDFRFDVFDRTIKLRCHTRLMTSEYSETRW